MQKKNRLQTIITSWTSLSLVLGLSGLNLMADIVKAAPVDLLISEINFIGSSTNAKDDWIELYNPTNQDITFGAPNSYVIYENAGLPSEKKVATLNAGTIKKNSYYLISKEPASNSTLNITSDQFFDAGTDDLDDIGAQYTIKKNDATIIDLISITPALVDTAQCINKDSSNNCILSSIIRTINGLDTSKAIGYNFDPTVQQYGTPTNQADAVSQTSEYTPNPLIEDSIITAISPISPTFFDVLTISGQKGTANAFITFKQINQNTLVTNTSVVDVRNDLTFSHTFSSAVPVGNYTVLTYSSDAFGNRSAERLVTKDYTINKLESSVNTVPQHTNKLNLTVSGSSALGAMYQIENSTTGIFYPPIFNQVNTDGTFSQSVDLLPNVINSIIVRTKIGSLNIADPIQIQINQDSVLPTDLIKEKIELVVSPPGTNDHIKGLPGAYTPFESNIKVEAYADSQLSKLIGTTPVNPDGSFNPINLGDNQNAIVYLVATDQAGNKSANPIIIENPINFAHSDLTINGTIGQINQNSAKISWEKVPGAVNYRLKYKVVGGTYSNPTDICFSDNCNFESTIIGLTPDTNYIFAIAAVDKNGNESAYTEYTFKTLAIVPIVELNFEENTTSNSQPSRVVIEDTPIETINTPTTNQPEEKGEVKSTPENEENENTTFWIILGILVGLAILATSGYFYWFGGEAGENALKSIAKNDNSEEIKKEDNAKPSKKDKRW